jgi:integrase
VARRPRADDPGERAISLGEEKDTKTAAHRTVRVLQPLAVDLREWRLRSGRPSETSLIFPSATGAPWTLAAYQSWRRRAFKRAIEAAGLAHGRPYDLRHSFGSLLLHEGRSVIYVAASSATTLGSRSAPTAT